MSSLIIVEEEITFFYNYNDDFFGFKPKIKLFSFIKYNFKEKEIIRLKIKDLD